VASHHSTSLAVSVIVPVRNGGDELRALVDRLRRQTVPRDRFEVIVADDGSTDGSTEGLGDDGWLSVSHGPPRNPYFARNRAAALARGRVLAFSDADCLPEDDWLERGLAALDRADIVAGMVRFIPPESRTAWALIDMDTFLDQEMTVRSGGAVTANLFVTRERFERLGGFDDTLANGGDQEFVRRCVADGGRLEFVPEAAVWHPARATAGELLGKVWRVHRRHAARESRAGRRPGRLTGRALVPLVQQVRSRRRRGRALGLDRRRLGDSGLRPTAWDNVRAVPIMYLLIPYLATAAQALGWLDGRRARRAEQPVARP
jgi:GT2 family glycosyltransferase